MQIDVNIPDGKSGDWSVESFEVSEADAEKHNMRAMFQMGRRVIEPGAYKRLKCNGSTIMSNTQAEIRDHLKFIYIAQRSKNVLINGLGLGVALVEILKSDVVELVYVIENSDDVIALVADHITDPRVRIVKHDALTYIPPKGIRFGAVWHDIWPTICADNLPEMHKLHRKYGRRADWQGSWCRKLCERQR